MHFDKKLGLALGVLLVGVVGAFFFRNESDSTAGLPQLEQPELLDQQIADNDYVPYLTGIEPDTSAPASATSSSDGASPYWEMPEFLKERAARRPAERLTSASSTPPAPIPFTTAGETVESKIPIPDHNRQWQVAPDVAAPNTMLTATATVRPSTHRVEPGDTLSALARRYLGDATRFDEIFEANRDTLSSPHDLRAGMVIKIPQSSRGIPVQPLSGGSADESPATPARNISSSQTNVIDSPGLSGAVANPPAASESDRSTASPGTRFVPFPRSPFAPGYESDETSNADPEAEKLKRFSQRPPADLPSLEAEAADDNAQSAEKAASAAAKVLGVSEKTYTVRQGDSLERIALRLFGDRAAAAKIYETNRSQLPDPNRLREGMRIVIPK